MLRATQPLRVVGGVGRAAATRRLLSTTPAPRKGVVDGAKDAAKKVDRAVADAAVKGIEKGGAWARAFACLLLLLLLPLPSYCFLLSRNLPPAASPSHLP